ncbi:hypothetical protein [Lentilactobacillus sp. Marseille-Q4993]|uniref:hypothetical protein n=1 Tax=Lentilactobacillus sp. Marseille-Q4993 TaxID=3039492 RepID=UPI0024BC9D2D|nr:hypothetical protein [Lentilactobacillus sp. Marseille-Q4993]
MADNKAELNTHHVHSLECGHTKILHNGHVDYVEENGHLHHQHEDHWDECKLEVTDLNPDGEVQVKAEVHDEYCGHETVPHGDHVDYLVNGRLQHVHDGHVDDHGAVDIVS